MEPRLLFAGETYNLALGKLAVASSIINTNLDAPHAVDADPATTWVSQPFNDEWIYVDLGHTATVHAVRLTWGANHAVGYKVQASPDGGTWSDILTVTDGDGGLDEHTGLSATGRYFRIFATERATTEDGVSLADIDIRGSFTPRNRAPVVPPISVAPAPVAGALILSSSATDDWDNDALIYTWSTVHKPAGAADAVISTNYSNGAQQTLAAFSTPGKYILRVRVSDGFMYATKDIELNVPAATPAPNPGFAAIIVTAPPSPLPAGGQALFHAVAVDAAGNPIPDQPTFNWSVDAGGAATIDPATGILTVNDNAAGVITVRASAGGISGSTPITVVSLAPQPSYPSGFSGTDLTLNGSARILPSGAVELTHNYNQTASVFYNRPLDIRRFSTQFSFQLLNPLADGFTFTIQNNSPYALGLVGGGLGAEGLSRSVSVKFDLFNNEGEGSSSTGVYDSAKPLTIPATNLLAQGIDLHSGHVFHASIAYDGGILTLYVTDATTNATATASYAIDIPRIVQGTHAYVGFTAGTGVFYTNQQILAWNYSSLL
jgi:hypothetical protein